jgi:transketolase
LEKVFADFRQITDRPKIVIADTIKGRGVSFMEHPAALAASQGIYRWHSGAPDDQSFALAQAEIFQRLQNSCRAVGLPPLNLELIPPEEKTASGVSRDYVADAFGQALLDLARERQDIVVLDADLAADCRVRQFEEHFPDRFVENGIAEQDMVSMAGGLARQGWLPVVNSFAAFLSSRANEQIYNNACENTRIIYVNHYSGLIPAGPGQSHQSIRDISLLGALPNFVIIQPCNPAETRQAVAYCIREAKDNCVLRLIISPCPSTITLPDNYRFVEGQGVTLAPGHDAVLFAYGPVMVHEALVAAEILLARNVGLQVVNMPWLNRVDEAWLRDTVGTDKPIYVLEDHAPVGGLGDYLLNVLVKTNVLGNRKFQKFGVEGFPAWGTPPEVLKFHGLDGNSLAEKITKNN